jgi:hypothetical protein
MSTVFNIPDLNQITSKYNKIIDNYKSIYTNLKDISEDIKVLEGVHNVYINSIDMSSLNYSIYVDDIKHQINITKNEYEYISKTFDMNIEKFYRDLFKLYNKITKIILTIFKENKDTIVKIWNSCEKISSETQEFKKLKKCIRSLSENVRSPAPITNDMKIFDEIKKQYYSHITIYNEISENKYSLEDVLSIYDNLTKRLNELFLSRELIKMNLIDIQNKTDKGVLGQTFVMDLNGKSDRINIDYSILVKILESIIGIHITLSDKYKNLAQTIADQVNYNEETSEVLSVKSNISRKNNDEDLFYSKDEE